MSKNKKIFYLVTAAVLATFYIVLSLKTKAPLNQYEEMAENTDRQTQEIIAYLEKRMPEIAEAETQKTETAVDLSLEKFFDDLSIWKADYLKGNWTKYFIVRPPQKTSSYIRQPVELEITIKKIFQSFLYGESFYFDGIIAEENLKIYLKEPNQNKAENLKKINLTARIRFDTFSAMNEKTYLAIGEAYMNDRPVKIKGTLKMPGWADSLEEIILIFESEIFIEIDSAEPATDRPGKTSPQTEP